MTGPPAVVVDGVAFGYGAGGDVLRHVSFALAHGEAVGILGRNGSGKTTILRLLAGRQSPSAGRMRIDGPGRPGVVLDHTPFLDPFDAAGNLRTTLGLRGRPDWEDVDAAPWLTAFGLDPDSSQAVGEFSLGMRRRLALAEAFASEPTLLLLDEPTLGLDPEGREQLAAALRGFVGTGASALVATNDAAFAGTTCDRVLFLHGGSIVAAGPPGDLVAALGAPTVLRLELTTAPPEAAPPAGFDRVSEGPRSVTLRGPPGAAAIGEISRWLESAGAGLRELAIREPDLADVFAATTGESLEPAAGPGS